MQNDHIIPVAGELRKVNPHYLANNVKGKFVGPFSTFVDAMLARNIGDQSNGWNDALILNREELNKWLETR